ncbi:MAG: hypothetical protein ACYC5O_23220 [Anaerolineae bacterium]
MGQMHSVNWLLGLAAVLAFVTLAIVAAIAVLLAGRRLASSQNKGRVGSSTLPAGAVDGAASTPPADTTWRMLWLPIGLAALVLLLPATACGLIFLLRLLSLR